MAKKFRLWGKNLKLSCISDDIQLSCRSNDIESSCHSDGNDNIDFTSHFDENMVFEKHEELLIYVRSKTAQRLGFDVRIENSILSSLRGKPRLVIDCSKSGPYRVKKPSSIDTGTKKYMCPFRLKGHKYENSWSLEVVRGFHNHRTTKYDEGHTFIGRLTDHEMELVRIMSMNSLKPNRILATLKKENPGNRSTIKTIHNARAKLRVLEHAGRTQVQQLLHLIQTKGYVWNLRSHTESEELQDILFAHTRSIQNIKSFPYILFMNCTYKTNRFRLSLMEIVDVTSTGNTFSVTFVFMQFEKIENYVWALQCLHQTLVECKSQRVVLTDRDMAIMHVVSVVFPRSNALLCKWHISNNVKQNCKSTLGDAWKGFKKQWKLIVDSNNLNEYQEHTSKMASTYASFPIALTYIGELLENYQVKFVALWTNQSMHYGNRTTNRAEAQHSKLKKYLRNSTANLATVFQYIDEMVELEDTKIKHALERSRNYVQHAYSGHIFKRLRGYVSAAGLHHISEEIGRCDYVAANGMEYCGCVLRLSHGLPCAHELHEYIIRGIPIPLDCIDQFWTKLDISEVLSSHDGLDCSVDIDKFFFSYTWCKYCSNMAQLV